MTAAKAVFCGAFPGVLSAGCLAWARHQSIRHQRKGRHRAQ